MCPIEFLFNEFVHSTLATVAGQNGITARSEKRGSEEADMTRCHTPCKEWTRTNTPSLSTLMEVFGFLTNVKAVGQYASLDCSVMNLANVSISNLSLSVTLTIKDTSGKRKQTDI